jgi:hypothetical protein
MSKQTYMHSFQLLQLLTEAKASSKVFDLKHKIINSLSSVGERLVDHKYFPHKSYDTAKAQDEIEASDGDIHVPSFSDSLAGTRFDDLLRTTISTEIRFAISKWLSSNSELAHPQSISIDRNEKKHHGAVGSYHYDDDLKIPQSKIPVKNFMVSGRFITILFHKIVDELRKRPKPAKTTKEEVYISRVNDSIKAAFADENVIKEFNMFCSIIVHEAQHLAQHKKGMHDKYFPNTQRNVLGNRKNARGEPINKLNYYAEYDEIDAYAVDLASRLLLDHVKPGTKANIRALMSLATHAFYTEFDGQELKSEDGVDIEPIRKRFIKRVVNALNDYNNSL